MTDTSDFQPVGIDPDSRPAFLYEDDVTGVDVNDPIYQQVVAAMQNDPRNAPPPAEAPRPPVMDADTFTLDADGNVVANTPEPPATNPPAVTTPPVADGAQIPAADTGVPSSPVTPAGEPPAGGSAPTEPPAGTAIEVEWGGQSYTLGQEEVNYLLQQNQWMQSLPDELKQQWAGVQDGVLVAVPREEYEALKAGQTAPTAPAVPAAPDLTYVDDDVKEYITRLQQSQAPAAPAPGQQPSYDQGPSAADMQAAATREAERQMRIRGEIASVTETFTADYSLTPEQAQRLQQVTVQLGVVPTLSRQGAVYSHTGQLISEAPMDKVMKQAYEIAMNTDPELKNLRDERVFNERLAAQQAADQRVNGKKALAGSLASAPSAAVPAGSGQPLGIGPNNQMNMQATSEAIARYLTEAQSQGA